MRMNHMKEQFRSRIAEKDALIAELRVELSSGRGEPEGQPSVRFLVGSSSSALLDCVDSDVEFASEERSQRTTDGKATWQELRDEVVKLRSEVLYWREQAPKNIEAQQTADSESVHHLRDVIETLKQQLADEVELRHSELTTLHNDHTNRLEELEGQLRVSESEVLDLRSRLEKKQQQPENADVSTVSFSQVEDGKSRLQDTSRPSEGSRKKQRGARKKKQLGEEPVSSSQGKLEKTVVLPLMFENASTQTLSETPDNSSDYEKLELTSDGTQTPPVFPEVGQVQVVPDHLSTGTQAQAETVTASTQVDELEVATGPAPERPTCSSTSQQASDGELSLQPTSSATCPSPLSSADDDQLVSSVPPTGDSPTPPLCLSDLVGQVNECALAYTSVVGHLLHLVRSGLLSTPGTADAAAAAELADKLTGQSQQLAARQEGLMSRLEALFSACRLLSDGTTSSTPVSSAPPFTSSSLVVPVSGNQTELSAQEHQQLSSDPQEQQHPFRRDSPTTDWQADSFVDVLPSATDRPADSEDDVGVDVETQTVDTDKSDDAATAELHATISELKTQLDSTSAMYLDELEELRSSEGQLRTALHSATIQVTSVMPPLPYAGEWPPTDPDAQLTILVTAEAAARSELGRVCALLHQAEASLTAADTENEQLQARLNRLEQGSPQHRSSASQDQPDLALKPEEEDDNADEGAAGVECDDEEPIDLVYRLCTHLSTEVPEELWDPERWDVTMYSVLQHHFGDAVPPSPPLDQVIQLTAEVTALRDILSQQVALRSQLERELQQLMTTVSTQRDQLQAIEAERQQWSAKSSPSLPDRGLNAFCEQVIKLVQNSAQYPSISTPTDPSGTGGNAKEKALQLLEHILHQLSYSSASLTRLQGTHESVVVALKEKHLESQQYHSELQRVCAELSSSEESRQSMQERLTSLQEELCQLKEELTASNEMYERNQSELEKAHSRLQELEKAVQSTENCPSDTVDGLTDSTIRETRLSAEVDRLQTHLIEMEQCYTSQAMQAESRELGLRSRLSDLETRVAAAVKVSETADERVRQAQTERDSLSITVEAQSKEINALQSNLSNLHIALDSFQQNERSAVALETEHLRHELERAHRDKTAAETQQTDLRRQLAERDCLIDQLQHLQQKVDQSLASLVMLENQIQERDKEIERLKTRLTRMAVDTDSKIDKILIKNLLLSYFQLSSGQRENGLRVIGGLLDFSDADFAKVNSNSGLFGWVRGAFTNLPSGPPQDVTFSSAYPGKSFTELLVAFLEQEATHQTPLKLPIDYYTPDVVRRNSASRRQVALNERPTTPNAPGPYFTPTPPHSVSESDHKRNSSVSP